MKPCVFAVESQEGQAALRKEFWEGRREVEEPDGRMTEVSNTKEKREVEVNFPKTPDVFTLGCG